MIILLPLLRRLNARTRLAVGLVLATVGLFLIMIAALANGAIICHRRCDPPPQRLA